LSLFPASPSHAQDAVTLVSNLTKGTLSTWYSLGTYWASTGFVTGPSTHGFYIESIAAALRIPATLTSEEIAKVRAELWINSDNVSQRPYSKLADLTVPSDLSDGNVSFGVNRVLNANATVHLVVYADGGLGKIGAWVISDTTQHAGAATGWGILDHAYIRSGAWFKYDTPMRIAVTGWARTQLSAPGNVVRTPDDSRITVNWDAVEGADRYRVEYGVANSGSSQKVTVDGATTYTIPNLVNGTPYAIRVQAQNSDEAHVDSPWSPWRQATPAIVPPPGPVVGLSVTPGSTQLALEWTAPSGSPTSYDVHYTSSTLVADGAAAGTAVATQWVAVTGTVTGTSHTITSLQNNTAYRVRVRGVNSAGAGDWAFGTGTPNPTTSGSTDATLSALVLTDHSSNAATLTPAFSSATYAYTAALNAYDGFRVTVTPTVSESNATVRVGMGTSLTEVTSNSASNAIELDYGTNRITVEVTAQAGNKRSYTITVDRALPKVVWPASTNTVSEDVGALTIQLESDGASNDMSGTVSYAAGATHPASLANDIGSGRSTAFTMASGDSHPSTIDLTVVDDALNEEHETFTITIEPGTGYTVGSPSVVTYTIDDNDPPAAPGSFSVNAGVAELTASWSKPAGPVAGYQTRWKETSAPDTLVTTGSDPADGWIVGGAISAASTSQKITDLANGTSYDVQVRADDGQTASGNGYGAWTATQQGAPEKPTMTFIGYTTLVSEGQGTATIYVRLSAALDSATTVSIAVDTISPAQGRAEETADFTLSTKTLNFAAGDTIKTFTASAVADRTTEGEESAYLQLIAVDDAPYALADPFEMELVITDLSGDPGLRIVASDVVTEGALDRMLLNLGNPAPPGGTVVTLSLGTGTATEGTDFTLSSKTDTIPEGQTWVEVRLTALADDVDDNAETVVLNASSTNPEFTADTRTVLIGDTNTPAASAPQNVMVTSGLGTLTVTWEVPAQVSAVTQGSEYQVYVNRRKKGSGDDWPANPTARSTAQRDARSVTLTGLSTVAYEVRVQFRFQSEADPVASPGVFLSLPSPATIVEGTPLPGTPTGLTVTPGGGRLDLTWAAPSGTVTDYDVHYTSADAQTVADTATASGSDAATAWVEVSRTGTDTAQPITGLENDRPHRVRVRAVNAGGAGPWEFGSGTPTAPSVSLGVSPNPVAEGADVTVTATLSKALTSAVAIPLDLTDGSAESGDYGTLASITVAANATTGTGTIRANQDADADDETFTVALGTLPSSVKAGTTTSVEVTITDDEKPTVTLSASPNPVREGSSVTITATLTAVLSNSVTIPLTLTDDSAEPSDHGTLASITVAAGQTTGEGTITTNHDTGEDDETFTVALGSPLPAAVRAGGTTSVEVRISDDEGIPAVTLSASPNPVAEGSDVTVTATLSKVLTGDMTIPLTLTDGSAESGDYAKTLTGITVTGGQMTGEGTIRANQDTDADDETFTVALGTLPSSVKAGTTTSVEVTITDDDKATVTLEASPNPVGEGETVTVTARLDKALPGAVTIPLVLSKGTAEASDYGELAGISIPPGRRSGTGAIETVRDTDEDDETFTVALGSALPSTVLAGSPASLEVTIHDEGKLRAELSSSTLRPAEGRSARLTATLSHPAPAGGVRVRFYADADTTGNPAHPLSDFTLAPAADGQNATASIDIREGERSVVAWLRVVDDDESEDDERLVVWLQGSWTTDTPDLVLTIPANDGGGGTGSAAWIEAEPNPVMEGRDVTVWVWLTKALDADATIPLTVSRGTSEEGDHGTLDEVVIAAGATFGSGTISTTRDEDADDEIFTVRLGQLPAGVTAGTASSVEIVIDDEDEPEAWLEVEPNPVDEGEAVTVAVKLTEALSRSVTIPIEVERVTSESGDHGTLSGIRIASGETEGTGRITTRRDDDGDDETFTVRLAEDLPSGVEAGHPDSVEVVIVDEGGAPAPAAVSLEAAPDPVPEGESLTVTATLSKVLSSSVTIPVEVERGTSESGDHGSLSQIRIASGEMEGTGTVTTRVDDDTDDETFTVKLRPNLPTGVEAGSPDSVVVTIADRGGEAPGRVRSLRVTAGDARLDLAWTAPSSGSVTAYEALYKEQSGSAWTVVYESGGNYADTEAVIEGLDNGTAYDVRVRATNDHGVGPWVTDSGTPKGPSSANDLTSLSVGASKESDGTYSSVSLSPSFRSSTTAYKVMAPAGTRYARFRPRAASSEALILVHGQEVASGAESPAIRVAQGTVIWIAVIPADNSTAKEYSITFSIPQASMDAARSVKEATDAALAIVGELSPEDAAGALLGERSLRDDRLEALDRLGNGNGRYDLGDLLAWIERCRRGEARCGKGPGTPPPTPDPALPAAAAAIGAGALPRRPRRRRSGRRRPGQRRTGMFAALLAAALWSCDGAGGPTATVAPDPGYLAVEWTAPAGGPAAAGALVEIEGPGIAHARAPGLELYAAEGGKGPARFVVAGELGNGPALEFRVPDRRLAGLYSVRIVEVAGADHQLLDTDDYRAAIRD